MLVWLPSYPRSGNTLTRLILNQVFDLKTHTIVGSQGDANFIGKQDVMKIIGAADDPVAGQDLIDRAQNSETLHIVKTHDGQLTHQGGPPALPGRQ